MGWTFPLRLGGLYLHCSICLHKARQHQQCNIQNVIFNSDELAFVWGNVQDRLKTLGHFLPLCSVQNVFSWIPPHNWNAVFLQTDFQPIRLSDCSLGGWTQVHQDIMDYSKGFLPNCWLTFLALKRQQQQQQKNSCTLVSLTAEIFNTSVFLTFITHLSHTRVCRDFFLPEITRKRICNYFDNCKQAIVKQKFQTYKIWRCHLELCEIEHSSLLSDRKSRK